MLKFKSVKIMEDVRETMEQVETIFNKENIVMMPDHHGGKGCCVGTTMKLKDRVAPSHVGSDIGCGVTFMKIGELPDGVTEREFCSQLDIAIRDLIPYGKSNRSNMNQIKDLLTIIKFEQLIKKIKCISNNFDLTERLRNSIGTLGGGNHFIELGKNKAGEYILFVHSGSRYLGTIIYDAYKKIAHEECANKIKSRIEDKISMIDKKDRQKEIVKLKKEYPIPDKTNEYLTGMSFHNYMNDILQAIEFAKLNRECIINLIIEGLNLDINYRKYHHTVHNYIDHNLILRKGAISAYKNEIVAIPLNMRDGIIIGIGKGNKEWNFSAPHGAGRIMSRTEAFNSINKEDHIKLMDGIYTTANVDNILDESPLCYKPKEEILQLIEETIEIEDIVTPVYNFKADDAR